MKTKIIIFSLLTLLLGCSKDDENNATPKSSEKQITSFTFTVSDNNVLTEDIIAIIDETNKTIIATVPFSNIVTNLTPTIGLSTEATASPESGISQNFTNPVTYTVIAEDNSRVYYTVSITVENDPEMERNALIAIYNENPNNALDWVLTDTDISNWTGVTTNSNGNITALNLSNKGLDVLPIEIEQLTQLIGLYIGGNNLDEIPNEIGSLTNLTHLHIDGNNLTTITNEIGNLTNLIYLDLFGNNLTTIPNEIGNLILLTELHLDNNNLTTIPNTIGNLTHLTYLGLYGNNLSTIPSETGNLTHLINLNLGENNLSTIPDEIWSLTNLTYLYLSRNNLVIPNEIGNLTKLTYLSLSENNLNTIPSEIGNLTNLITIYLNNNPNLNSIPSEICDLSVGGTIIELTNTPATCN